MMITKSEKQLKDVTITHVSYVKRGANKRTFFLAKSDGGSVPVEFDVRFFSKSDDDEQQLLYGVVYEPNESDTHGDVMTAAEIERTAHEFLVHYRNMDREHDMRAGAGEVVESYITPISMSIGEQKIKKGSWILVTRANDETWQAFKDGEITGYSMFGIAREAEPVATSKGEQNLMKTVVDKLAALFNIKKGFQETYDDTMKELRQDPWFIMNILEKDYFESISWDTAPQDKLVALSASLKGAASFVDERIAEMSSDSGVSKSADMPAESATPAEPAENADNSENSENSENKDEEDDSNDVDEGNAENPEPKPTENEPPLTCDNTEENKTADAVAVLKSFSDSIKDDVAKQLADVTASFNAKIEELSKSITDTNNKLDDTRTQSSVRVGVDSENYQPSVRGAALM